MAHQNVQNRMNAAKRPADALPTDTFLEERRRTFHNGDAIEMLWQPNAITDGDSLVHFRRADVIVTGNIFTTTQYPFIDVANGGTVEGEIKALNEILERTVFEHQGQGGTLVVPGHGISRTSTRSSSTATWWSSSAIAFGRWFGPGRRSSR